MSCLTFLPYVVYSLRKGRVVTMAKTKAEPKVEPKSWSIIYGDKKNRWEWKEAYETCTLAEIEKKYGYENIIKVGQFWICD